jgi:CheY-like chemotaxis protein
MKSALLVVPDPAVRLRLRRIFARHGWWVDAVDSVERALAFFDERPRDVALIDRSIDAGSGLALLAALKTHALWQAIPVVMLDDSPDPAGVERAFELGANDFLRAPFTDRGALLTLERWVLDRASRDDLERSR